MHRLPFSPCASGPCDPPPASSGGPIFSLSSPSPSLFSPGRLTGGSHQSCPSPSPDSHQSPLFPPLPPFPSPLAPCPLPLSLDYTRPYPALSAPLQPSSSPSLCLLIRCPQSRSPASRPRLPPTPCLPRPRSREGMGRAHHAPGSCQSACTRQDRWKERRVRRMESRQRRGAR